MLRLGTIVLGVEDVDRAVAFWAAALGYRPHAFDDAENDFTILIPPLADGTRVAIQRTDTPAQPHPRVHLDLIVDGAAEQALEVDRLVALGAQLIDWDTYPDDPDFVVLADPDGNRFCIVDAAHG
jgi:catechol 2,3-dioxygenase-like lactoylglutathione lyase family enzyme